MDKEQISVLLVEDNPGDARLIQEALKEARASEFELLHVGRLQEALRRLAEEPFQLILLDLSLPDAFGLDTLRQAHAAAPEIPIVILTGLDDEESAVRAVQEGAQDYLVKGRIDGNLLVRSLRYAIERNRMRAALVSLSLIDDLTGLYNRRGFLTLAERHLQLAKRRKRGFLFLFADMDGLKEINDSLGHTEGDRALIETPEVFREAFRSTDIIARLGGDEFAAIPVDSTGAQAEIFIARITERITNHNSRFGRKYVLSLSVGKAFYQVEHPCSVDDLIARADTDMYSEKRSRRHHGRTVVIKASPSALSL